MGRLTELLQRAAELDTQQRDGQITVRSATARKRDLRRQCGGRTWNIWVRSAGRGRRSAELARKFILSRKATPYLAIRMARGACRPRRWARRTCWSSTD